MMLLLNLFPFYFHCQQGIEGSTCCYFHEINILALLKTPKIIFRIIALDSHVQKKLTFFFRITDKDYPSR